MTGENPGAPLPETMTGAVLLGPEKIEIREVPVPEIDDDELLLRVGAATTCGTDVKVFRRGGHPRMLRVPTLFGHEMAGTIARIGSDVKDFAPGDRVVVANSAPCGRCGPCEAGRENLCEDLHYLNGAFARYVRVPGRFVRRNTHRLPDSLSFERGALTEPLACVLHGVDALDLERRSRESSPEVIVLGGGPIGLLFVGVLARRACRVILADPSPTRLERGRAFGAAETLEIERGGGQSEVILGATRDGAGAPFVVEATGVPAVWEDAIRCVRTGGLVNLFGGCAPGTTIPLDTHRLHYGEITLKGVYHHRPDTVRRALELLAEEDFPADLLLSGQRPVEEVEEALRSMMRKEAIKVVITP